MAPANSRQACPGKMHCAKLILKYLSVCLCNWKEGLSLSIGYLSVFIWFVAEIPQIITNYKEKSTAGISMVFLMTWLLGDISNLIGCILEPETLPMQYYSALFFTVTSLTLLTQCIYYNHIYPRIRNNRNFCKDPTSHLTEAEEIANEKKSGAKIVENSLQQHLLDGDISTLSTTRSNKKSLRCVVFGLAFFGAFQLQNLENKRSNSALERPTNGIVLQVGRRLLEVGLPTSAMPHRNSNEFTSSIATFLGWAMAAVYMGGRLPQISLIIKRGHVEGVNPLMFLFAWFGNVTYVASILINSVKWTKIKPNLPWLIDAVGCVLLDTFILLQIVYYRRRKSQTSENKHENYSIV